MPRLEAAIYAILSADVDITAIVSTRIYPMFLPQDCPLPAITYFRVSTIRESSMHTDPGIATARIQVSCWARNAHDAGDLADKVRQGMHRYIGVIAGITIKDNAIENEISTYDPDTEEYQVALDFMVSHLET